LTLLIALGLWKAEKWLIRGFTVFGLLMTALSTVGLLLGAGEYFFGKSLLPQLAPIDEALLVVGRIALVLAGAFPMMELLNRLLRRPLGALGKKLSMNETSVGGLLSSSVNSIATFDAVSRMDPRGKVVNMAFAVSAAFVFGDHLAYTAGVLPSMILPLIVGKLSAGISAVAIALLLTRSQSFHTVENKENQDV
jgi:ethanolamine transporter